MTHQTRIVAIAVCTALALTASCSDDQSSACAAATANNSGTDTTIHWTRVTSPVGSRLNAVRITGLTTGVAVGDSGAYLIYGGGTSWTYENVGPSQQTKNFYGVESSAAGEVWIVGDDGTILHAPTLLGGWSQQTSTVSVTLFGIRRVGSELFAVGDGGIIIHSPDGNTWSAIASSTAESLFAVAGLNDSTWLATGRVGAGVRYNGSSWSTDATGSGSDLRGLAVVGDSVVRGAWIVGDAGSILHSATGATGTWSGEASGTMQTLFGIVADTAGNRIAVGAQGTMLRWNGSAWVGMRAPTRADIRAVDRGFNASGEYWAAGACGVLLHGTTP